MVKGMVCIIDVAPESCVHAVTAASSSWWDNGGHTPQSTAISEAIALQQEQ